MGYEVRGGAKLIENLLAHPEKIQRAADSVLKQEARALCVSYGMNSEPYGLKDGEGQEKFRESVRKDVRRVFASKQQPAAVYALLKAKRPDLAGLYWHYHKAGKKRKMGEVLQRAGLPEGVDPAALKAARTGPGGRVRKGMVPVSVAAEPQVKRLANEQARLVGTAKAGWYAAARSLGGRVRKNFTDGAGQRKTAELFPAYVRKLARRWPEMGGSRLRAGMVEVFTRVRHGDRALDADRYAKATDAARESLAASLSKAVKAVNEKVFRKVA